MRRARTFCLVFCFSAGLFTGSFFSTGLAQEKESGTPGISALETLLKGIEACYTGTGFSARFDQTSSLAAMDITDHAQGTLFVKYPNRMRWEYVTPETQVMLTDGKSLWIHRPADNQVLVGKAPAFLGSGQGGSFLTDLSSLRKQFTVSLVSHRPNLPAVLKLLPGPGAPDVSDILISVDPETFRIHKITTHNAYGDETRIQLSDYRFDLLLDDAFFRMEIPKSAEVLELEGEQERTP